MTSTWHLDENEMITALINYVLSTQAEQGGLPIDPDSLHVELLAKSSVDKSSGLIDWEFSANVIKEI